MPRLVVDNLHATYRYSDRSEVLRGVSFELEAGRVLLISGLNGSGKSTLLSVLSGLLPLTSGSIRWDGQEPVRLAYGAPVYPWAGLQRQSDNVLSGLTVAENIGLAAGPRRASNEQLRRVVNDRFAMLDALWNKRAGLLSGGQQKVVALAMATIQDRPLLLLDEPLAGLSGETALAVLACLRARKECGAIMVIVEHSHAAFGEGLIDDSAEMTEGRLTNGIQSKGMAS